MFSCWMKPIVFVVSNCTSSSLLFHANTSLCGGVCLRCNFFICRFAPNAPPESYSCLTKIIRYHQNPLYTHRILFTLAAWHSTPVKTSRKPRYCKLSWCSRSRTLVVFVWVYILLINNVHTAIMQFRWGKVQPLKFIWKLIPEVLVW